MIQRVSSLRLKLTLWFLSVFLLLQLLLLGLVAVLRREDDREAFRANVGRRAEVMVDNVQNAAPPWTGEVLRERVPADARFVTCALRADSGRILAAFDLRLPEALPFDAWERAESGPHGPRFTELASEKARSLVGREGDLLVVTLPFLHKGERYYLQAAVRDGLLEYLKGPQLDFVRIGFPIGMLAALIAAWFIAGRAVAPIRRVAEAARSVRPENLGARIPLDSTDGEYTRLAQELNAALARLHDGYQVLERFISDVSHELKTPIAVLLTESQVVRMGPARIERYEEFVREVELQMQQLGRLVESFLALARAGMAPGADAEPVSLNDLVLESTRASTRLAQRGEVRLVPRLIAPAEDAPECELGGDATLLQTMLDNLVRNAVRHSPPGGVVEIEAGRAGERARIDVRDRGPGIPEGQLDRVFEPFVRVAPERGGGTGLGLSIARRIAELYGGTIVATNRAGGGSEFRVTLPAREVAAPVRSPS